MKARENSPAFLFIVLLLIKSDLALADDTHWWMKNIQAIKNNSSIKTKEIIVAVIDTGFDTTNSQLQKHLWRNPNEIPNGIDDDNNGLIDDIHGWSFSENSHKLMDNHGHGTHIAGIILQLAPHAKIMTLKYYDPTHKANPMKTTAQCIEYAIRMGAHIINYSGGGKLPSHEEEALIKRALEKNILFVAAAGNEHSDSDESPFYPANYDVENIIAVTAIDAKFKVLKSSNFGAHGVHIAAPGHNIISNLPGNRQGPMTGTSQATAFVTGAAAKLLSTTQSPIPMAHLKRKILLTGTNVHSLARKTRHESALNVEGLMKRQDIDTSAFQHIIINSNSHEESNLIIKN